jgi:hypothetical protein
MPGVRGLNNVLHHLDNRDPQCTFCVIQGKLDLENRNLGPENPEYNYYLNLLPREDISHLFWDCIHVQDVVQKAYRWIRGFNWYRGQERIEKDQFFQGIWHEYAAITMSDLWWKHYVKFFVFKHRSMVKIPRFPSLKYEMEGILNWSAMRHTRRNLSRIHMLYE